LKEYLRDKEKEIRKNRINLQKSKITNQKTFTPNNTYGSNLKNKNIFSPLNKEKKKINFNENLNSMIEKVEINLEKNQNYNFDVKSPKNKESRIPNSDEKLKNKIWKFNNNTSPHNRNNNKIMNDKEKYSINNHFKSPENPITTNSGKKIPSSFNFGSNNHKNKIGAKYDFSSPKNLSGKKQKIQKMEKDKKNFLTNNLSNAFALNIKSENEFKDLNECIGNKRLEKKNELEIEEYEEISKFNPKMKVLEFIANKLVEKSKYLDGNLFIKYLIFIYI